ncbi:general stress protein [Bacillus mangrovi]|uniref:General stress protein n=1 Tax=Metabacillus mangrovi TaxID=1491830 RepID=A0A7X2V5X7_9BACI|nr:NAD(P)H-dependent oxidoreductase [Metabacillus mangrovi]MTH54885.1 general stress protein [Metabacillus mangrovi]
MKTLVLTAHPNMKDSTINKAWTERLRQENNITVHDLYEAYPNFKIDVQEEQELLLSHDRIIFQFPFYWYSSPAILKEWQDVVLTYGWAYGAQGTKLHGKQFGLAVSTGGPKEAYQAGGYNKYSMNELLKPFEAMSNLTGMKIIPAFLEQGVRTMSPEQVQESAERLAQYVTAE